MKPIFESIKNLGDIISHGKIFDKNEPEPIKQDNSNQEHQPTPQNHDNSKRPEELNDSKQINSDAPPKRKKRTVIRLCHYCHEYFTANRRDANYCCSSHRQMANKKGYYFRYHGNPAEHYLVKAIRFDIEEILKHDHEEITKNTVNKLHYMSIVARPLFLGELSEDNHLVVFYSKYIEEFIAYLTNQFRNLNSDRYVLMIPQSTLDVWQRFLDATA